MTPPLIIRPSTAADLPDITASTATPSRTAPVPSNSISRTRPRWRADATTCWPRACRGWLPTRAGVVLGYAYANHFRPRRAYRFCLEDSIYLDPAAQGQGVGRVLLAELLAQCEARGARQMLAVIGDSANAGSIGVHRACGFEPAGMLKAAGWKFDRWLDVVLMQKSLGAGSTPPRRTIADALQVQDAGDLARAARRQPRLAPLLPAWLARRARPGCTRVPTLAGLMGVRRVLELGQDDRLSWLLLPLLGLMLAQAALLRHRLRPDPRRTVGCAPQPRRAGASDRLGPGARRDRGPDDRCHRADGHDRIQRPALLRVAGRRGAQDQPVGPDSEQAAAGPVGHARPSTPTPGS